MVLDSRVINLLTLHGTRGTVTMKKVTSVWWEERALAPLLQGSQTRRRRASSITCRVTAREKRMFEGLLTDVLLVRKTLQVRRKFQQLVDVKVQGFNREYAGRREPLPRPTVSAADSCIECILSPSSICSASLPIPSCSSLIPKSETGVSVAGFVVGSIFSWVYLWLMQSMLATRRSVATSASVVILVFLSLGLAFSSYVRLLCLVSIATLCSSTGRAILIVMIVLLAYRGPVNNCSNNGIELVRAIACSAREAAAVAGRHVGDKLSPVRDFWQTVQQASNSFIRKARDRAHQVKQTAEAVTRELKKIAAMLPPMPQLGRKRYRCTSYTFHDGVGCDAAAGFFNLFMSYVSHLYENLAREAQLQVKLAAEALQRRLQDKVKAAADYVAVNVSVDDSLQVNSTQDVSWEEVMEAVAEDFYQQVAWLEYVVQGVHALHPLLSLLILIRAALYIRSYRRKLHYDNLYITSGIRDLDAARARDPFRETLLPLTPVEARDVLTHPLSLRLAPLERRKLWLSILVLCSNVAFVASWMLADVGLYYSVKVISRHSGDVQVSVDAPTCNVSSNPASPMHSFESVAAFCSGDREEVVGKAKAEAEELKRRAAACFPAPSPPDYDIYRRIGLLLLVCLLSSLMEAYTLRARHAVCDAWHEERAKARAAFLYNSLMAARGSLAAFLQDNLRANLGFRDVERASFAERIATQCPLLRSCLQPQSPIFCSHCGKRGDDDDDWIPCESDHRCGSRFCARCILLLDNLCPTCAQPIALPDSDDSVEEDSGDEGREELGDESHQPTDMDQQRLRKQMRRLANEFMRTGVVRGTGIHEDWQPATEEDGGSPAADPVAQRRRLQQATGIPARELLAMTRRATAFFP